MTKFHVFDTNLDQPTQALSSATKAIELSADRPGELAQIARQLARREDPNGYNVLAHSAVTRAIELAPNHDDVRTAEFSVLAAMGRDDEALAAAKKAVTLLRDNPAKLASLARQLGAPDADGRCHDLALSALELVIAAEPEEAGHLQTKFRILAVCKKDSAAANNIGRYLIEMGIQDANLLNSFAWDLLTNEEYEHQFNELALASAEKSHEASGGSNWMYLDTFALAKFDTGDVDGAIEFEEKALELCPADNPGVSDLKNALDRFTAAKK